MSQWQPITLLAQDVQSGKVTASSNVERALKTIDDKHEYDAVISSMTERARSRAKKIDDEISKGGHAGRLAGVPFIAKDNFLTFGGETTAASNILRGFKAPYQATAIERLEAEGAICVAKANLDAFAHGSSTENSDFMVTKNPHDKTRVPGGSSGGSAAAVILDMVPFALGTDTGGSIRLPASYCGAVGLKPTYGLVSRSGVVAMASSTDVIGPITRTVSDAAIVLDIMAGKDELDSTTIGRNDDRYDSDETTDSLKGVKVGLISEYMGEGVDEGVKELIAAAVSKMKSAGANVIDVSLPSLPLALAAYYIIVPAEVSSNLSRYDGQRYGFSHTEASSLDDSYDWSRSEGFGNEAKRRIMIGTYVLSSGYYDAYYRRAQQVRTRLIEEFTRTFENVDFLLGPVAPTTAFKIGQNIQDPMQMYLADIMTVAVNLAGIPAIALPAGLTGGLPVGIQLMAPMRHDRALLNLAKSIEGVMK